MMKSAQETLVEFEIREATLHDKLGIISLIDNVMREFDLPVNMNSIEADIETAVCFDGDNTTRMWIAIRGAEIVASIGIMPKSEKECLLKRFYVMRQYRGLGLGKQLYILAEQFARRVGYEAVELEASRRFVVAIAFYLRNGYQLVKQLDNAWEDDIYRKLL